MMRNGLHINADGTKQWYLNHQLHRTDGPAVEYAAGSKEWWLDGQRHRTDGPAVELADGTKGWCLNGRFYSFNLWLEANTEISDQQRVMLKLVWV
jgi:hypothetical protein